MITLAIVGALALLAVGAGLWWYLDSRTAMAIAAALACAAVASAFVFRSPPPPRDGIAVAVDDSCDAANITPTLARAIRGALAPGVNGNATVVLSWFSYDAQTTRRILLNLTDAPPASVRGDAVAFANWKAPRTRSAEHAMTRLKTSPCRRVGTSVVGAAEAANAELEQAGVKGRREIVLVTNLVEYSSSLKIQAHSFGPADVQAAVRAIAQLPAPLRPRLGAKAAVRILFVPIVRDDGKDIPLAETTAVALESWARRVFRDVLHAGSVRIEVVASAT